MHALSQALVSHDEAYTHGVTCGVLSGSKRAKSAPQTDLNDFTDIIFFWNR